MGISGHAPRRLEAQNWRGASSFTVFTLTLCLPLSFSLLCALLLHSSLSLTLPFSLSRILSHFVSLSCSYFQWYVVFSLACCSPPSLIVFCGFIHSIFAFFGFDRFRLGWFPFTGFVLTIYKRYVFLSLYAWNAFWMFIS